MARVGPPQKFPSPATMAPLTVLLFYLIALLVTATPASAQDADAGRAVFHKCAVCHSPREGQNRIGPSLYQVVGRKAGTEPGFQYSPGVRALGWNWTPDHLNRWLSGPRALVPGTKMTFPGLPDPADRSNVIAYLETLHDAP